MAQRMREQYSRIRFFVGHCFAQLGETMTYKGFEIHGLRKSYNIKKKSTAASNNRR